MRAIYMESLTTDIQPKHFGLIFAACWVVYSVIASALKTTRRSVQAKKLGCGSTRLEKTKYPLGIDMMIKLLKADRQERTPGFLVSRFGDGKPSYTWRSRILFSEYIVTADVSNIQTMLAVKFSDFGLAPGRRSNMKPFLGKSIFAVDGHEWSSARETLRPLFARKLVSDLDVVERHFQKMLQCLSSSMDDTKWTGVASLKYLFARFTIDSSTELLLGKSTDSMDSLLQSGGLEPKSGAVTKDVQWAFDRTLELLGLRLRFRSFYWLVGSFELKETIAILHDFVDGVIADMSKSREKTSKVSTKYDILKELTARCNTSKEVRDNILGLLSAGRDTTAALISWVFYCLIRNERVFQQLRRTVLDNFGTSQEPDITYEKLKSCTYLQNVLNETLRLHTIVPWNSRCALRDTVLPTGGGPDGNQPIFVPKGTEVNYSPHMVHRRPDIWGPDVNEFVPERWEKMRPGWHFLPFSGGPRICLGQQLALTDAGYIIVRLLQHFDKIEGVDMDTTRDYHHFGLLVSPGPGKASVRVKLHFANDSDTK